jgi:hypothetical protein
MKIILILLLGFAATGCQCEEQRPLAEIAFIAMLEPGATAPSEAELEAFKNRLTRLNFKQLNRTLEYLNQEHLKELVPERTQFWAIRKDPPPTWQDAAYAIVDELLEGELNPYATAEVLDFANQERLKNQLFLKRLGVKHPRKGELLLMRYYEKSIDYNNDNFPGEAARPFFSAIYKNGPTHAKTLLARPIASADYSKQSFRSDGFQACLFSATSPREIEELLEMAISCKFQNYYGGFHGIINPIYYPDRNILTHLTHGIALLASMDPQYARDWISERKDKLDENWGIGYLSGAIGFPKKVPEDFKERYEAAAEFIALHSFPGSKTLERSIAPYGTMTSPQLELVIKKIRDQQGESKLPTQR